MMSRKKYIVAFFIILITSALPAQETSANPAAGKLIQETSGGSDNAGKDASADSSRDNFNTDAGSDNETGKKGEELPSGFMNIKLGLSMEDLEKALKENSYFDYRGKPDVDMRIARDRSLIECSGFSYVKKGYFQFYNEKLIVITVILDEKELDYYSFYTDFEDKYGKPHHLNPEGVYWENDTTVMALEKPLSVKYTDIKSFTEIKEKSAAKTSREKELKEDFIENF